MVIWSKNEIHNFCHHLLIKTETSQRPHQTLIPMKYSSVLSTVQCKSHECILSWELEGRYRYSKMFRWESEGHYRHRHTMIAPFWFSMEHLWLLIAPFWFSMEHLWLLLAPFWFSIWNIFEYWQCRSDSQVRALWSPLADPRLPLSRALRHQTSLHSSLHVCMTSVQTCTSYTAHSHPLPPSILFCLYNKCHCNAKTYRMWIMSNQRESRLFQSCLWYIFHVDMTGWGMK